MGKMSWASFWCPHHWSGYDREVSEVPAMWTQFARELQCTMKAVPGSPYAVCLQEPALEHPAGR